MPHGLLDENSGISKITNVCVMDNWGQLPTVNVKNSTSVYYYTYTFQQTKLQSLFHKCLRDISLQLRTIFISEDHSEAR